MENGRVVTSERPWFKVWPRHLPKSLEYPLVPAWWLLEKNIKLFGDRDAVIFINHEDMSEIERLSYAELYKRSVALSQGLRNIGVQRGDRIATVLPNSPPLIQSYYGIWMAGGTIVPNNPMARGEELRKTFINAEIKVVIASEQSLPEVRKAVDGLDIQTIVASVGRTILDELSDDACRLETILDFKAPPSPVPVSPEEDVAVILYTGGTTGEPKGAMLTHRNIVTNTIQFAEWYAFEPGEERCVCVIPMSHSGGMSGVMNVPVYSGATLLVMQRANPSVIGRVVEKYKATRLFGVHTLFAALLNDEEACKCDYSSLKACRTGAAPLPVQIKKAFDEVAGKEVLVEAYGITETSPLAVANPIDRPKAGSIGIPLPDTDVRIVDIETGEEVPEGGEGELLIRGPQVMKGYLGRPDATAEAIQDGWFRSGDVVRMDEEGYLYVVDRLKDFINASGFKVWPREVEEVLYKYPGVKLCAVIGVPDAYRGENVKAFIVPTDESRGTLNIDDIIAHCKRHLSSYKVPRKIEFRDQLPLSPAGKILRRVLRDEERGRCQ